MKIINTIEGMRTFSNSYRQEYKNHKISFVATMGFLHEGHISLMQKAKQNSKLLVVSVFLNPTQFDNAQDLEKYPRNDKNDIKICNQQGVDVLFMPSAHEVYPSKKEENTQNYSKENILIDYPSLTSKLCGKFRSGHFSGVLWIVHNLLLWVQPHLAYFGLKDYQQFILIRQMVFDLSLPVEIRAGALMREKNGLALSSRNVRLSQTGKEQALKISQALSEVKEKIEQKQLLSILDAKELLQERLSNLSCEYLEICHPLSLESFHDEIKFSEIKTVLLAVAVYIEKVRLIDNILCNEADSEPLFSIE